MVAHQIGLAVGAVFGIWLCKDEFWTNERTYGSPAEIGESLMSYVVGLAVAAICGLIVGGILFGIGIRLNPVNLRQI